MKKHHIIAALLFATTWVGQSTAMAEVRIGNNVRIGGHDVSNQTFTKERNGVFYIYEDNPKNPGCRWRKNANGSKTKVCHLKRKN